MESNYVSKADHVAFVQFLELTKEFICVTRNGSMAKLGIDGTKKSTCKLESNFCRGTLNDGGVLVYVVGNDFSNGVDTVGDNGLFVGLIN